LIAISAEAGLLDDALLSTVQQDAEALLACLNREEELSLLFCGDQTIAGLNARWRDVDAPTDVLSFPQGEGGLLGDLAISVETARRQATVLGHTLLDEIRVLMVHGLLHLLGHDHESAQEWGVMAAEESRLLSSLGWTGVGLVDRSGDPTL
jgi:rRNA maturation RNase YbeY